MYFKECPKCGAHLDPGERCDCQDKKEDAPDAPGTPSSGDVVLLPPPSVANWRPNVNDCLNLREILRQTGAMGKEVALVVRDTFPSFNRQLLAQCQAPEKYGIIIHPDGLATICAAYGIAPVTEDAPSVEVITAPEPHRKPHRKLARKLTFRMRDEDYALLERRVREAGYQSSQAWLYDVVMKALRGEAVK